MCRIILLKSLKKVQGLKPKDQRYGSIFTDWPHSEQLKDEHFYNELFLIIKSQLHAYIKFTAHEFYILAISSLLIKMSMKLLLH